MRLNPWRHTAGKPFHAFLIGWRGQGHASLRFRRKRDVLEGVKNVQGSM
jgi:hypothetical protein